MSLTINMVGGGGGSSIKATDAVIRVQAPAGSTVTASKTGYTTKTGIGFVNADNTSVSDYYIFIKQSEFNSTAWTVTATLSGQSSTGSIVVNSSKEFGVVLDYLVPSTYQKVTYLQSSGTQYINMGLTMSSAYTFKGGFRIISASSAVNVFGVENAEVFFESSAVKARLGTSLKSVSASTGTDYTFTLDSSTFTLNGTSYSLSGSGSIGSGTIYMFARNWNGVSNRGSERIYSFSIYNGSTLVRDFIPCYRKSDNVAGMFETVTQSFFTNSGTGSFSVGGPA